MFHLDNITGDKLKDKQLCLSFDDGPGPLSLPIAQFLNELNIRACFFVVGKYAQSHMAVLEEIAKLGHLIGNHTYEHPDLPAYCAVNGDVQDQLLRTNALIAKFNVYQPVFFRAPYGKWSPEVANALNVNLKSSMNMVGPIHWEIPGIDCHYWNIGKSVDEAVQAYIHEIEKVGKGIMVMHDDIADMDHVKPLNKTFELVKVLIPKLLSMGYSFVGLDQIDGLVEEEKTFNRFFIQVQNDRYLHVEGKDLSLQSKSKKSEFELLDHLNGKVFFLTENKLWLSCNSLNQNRVYLSEAMNAQTEFDYIPVRENAFMLRNFSGHYVQVSASGVLNTEAQFMRQATVFYAQAKYSKIEKKLSFSERMLLFKKKLLFVKSKLLSK